MPVYIYKAISSAGEEISGSHSANTRDEVIRMLRLKEAYPVKIEEEASKDLKQISFLASVRIKDISIFCRQFYTMLNAGVTILNCLLLLKEQTENRRLRSVVSKLYEEVQKGKTFSEALKQHDRVFPPLLIHMVEAGEVSGSLDVVMSRLAQHYEKENKIINKVKSAMLYPLILSIVAATVVIFLLTFVMPTFLSMFEGSGLELPLPTRIMLAISSMITQYWYLILLMAGAAIYGIKLLLRSDKGRYRRDGMLLKLPAIKGITQKIIAARFTRTLSTLLYSGTPLLQALESAAGVVSNEVARQAIAGAREDVKKGVELSSSVRSSGIFPPMVDNMIKIGEESGTLDEILEHTAVFYDEEVDAALQKMTTLIEPLMIVVMAVLIGFIVISMILPMFDMINAVSM